MDIERMDPEMLLEADASKGLNQPGLAQGLTYVDCNGNTRRKYETLQTITNTTAVKLQGLADDTQTAKVQDEDVKDIPAPVKETKTLDVQEDRVEVAVAKEAVKPKAKRAPAKKTVKTTTK